MSSFINRASRLSGSALGGDRRRLDVPFRRTSVLLVARAQEQLRGLDHALHEAEINGVAAHRLDAESVHAVAPYVAPDVLAAVEVPADGVVDPIRLTLGYAELAARKGVRFALGAPVLSACIAGELGRPAWSTPVAEPAATLGVAAVAAATR